jgi:hypothetical protein
LAVGVLTGIFKPQGNMMSEGRLRAAFRLSRLVESEWFGRKQWRLRDESPSE